MNSQEAQVLVNETWHRLQRNLPDGKIAFENSAFNEILKTSAKLAAFSHNPEIHWPYDQLVQLASHIGPECGLRVSRDFWNALSQKQIEMQVWQHKGLPLFRMWGLYQQLGRDWERRRFALLTLIEDALRDTKNGIFESKDSGAYFQAQSQFGLDGTQLNDFGRHVIEAVGIRDHTTWSELLLEQLLSTSPLVASLQDSGQIGSNQYVPCGSEALLLELIAQGTCLPVSLNPGDHLEVFASLAFGALPAARTKRKDRGTFETDVLVDLSDNSLLAPRFGRLVLVECKDWNKRLDVTIPSKLLAALNLAGCTTGIIFSKKGLTGRDKQTAATKMAIASFMKLGVSILVLDQEDINTISRGQGLASLLIQKQIELQIGRH